MCYCKSIKVLLRVIVTQLRSVLIFSVTTVKSTVTQYKCSYLLENVLQPSHSNTFECVLVYKKLCYNHL
jgi:hypothetical protein